ncbi:histidine kinase [Rhizobium ruizarguesonis]
MYRTFACALLAASMPLMANAATLKFPSDAPVATITIPDSWQPEETETGIQATSSDSAIYFSVDVADSKSMDKVTSDAIDFLSKNGVKVDVKTQKETPVSEVNGLQMTTLDWDGEDEDGPVSVGMAFIANSGDEALVVTYWGTKGDEDKHDSEIADMMMSIKMAH